MVTKQELEEMRDALAKCECAFRAASVRIDNSPSSMSDAEHLQWTRACELRWAGITTSEAIEDLMRARGEL